MEKKKLVKSVNNKKIAGVCAGSPTISASIPTVVRCSGRWQC
jgi:phage shock protein PspC (stress-responsive transcriptional regulator)